MTKKVTMLFVYLYKFHGILLKKELLKEVMRVKNKQLKCLK
jgi:hypothetical protein